MFGPMETPLYTNILQGLPGRFIYRNALVNLARFVPAHDPYNFDDRNVEVHVVDSSSDDEPGNFAASQGMDEPPNLPSQPNNPSLHESDAHTNPPMTYSRGSVDSVN